MLSKYTVGNLTIGFGPSMVGEHLVFTGRARVWWQDSFWVAELLDLAERMDEILATLPEERVKAALHCRPVVTIDHGRQAGLDYGQWEGLCLYFWPSAEDEPDNDWWHVAGDDVPPDMRRFEPV